MISRSSSQLTFELTGLSSRADNFVRKSLLQSPKGLLMLPTLHAELDDVQAHLALLGPRRPVRLHALRKAIVRPQSLVGIAIEVVRNHQAEP
jgi:hypothetical protein